MSKQQHPMTTNFLIFVKMILISGVILNVLLSNLRNNAINVFLT